MGKKTPLSPALGAGSRRDDTGGQLLRELEALSQVLYNAGQVNGGRPLRKETPSSPALASLPAPRPVSQEALLSPHLGGRAFQAPPSPYLGSRDSPSEEPPYVNSYRVHSESEQQPRSPYLGARKGDAPPSPYLGGLNGPQPEPRSPVIVTLNGSLRGGKPPRIEPVSPQIPVRRSVDSLSSLYIEGRRGDKGLLPRSPHLGGSQYPNGVGSPSLRSRRGDGRSPFLGAVSEESRSYESSDGMRGKGPQSPLGHFGRAASDSITSKSLGSLNLTELTLTSAAAALRSPSQHRPPMPNATRSFSPLSQSEDSSGKRIEPYSLGGGGRENGGLKAWHSQGFERTVPEVANFLEDNVQFSKQLEAPKEKRSLWNWKPFRAIAHIGAQRINCMFTVHVHGIEGLPAVTNGLRLAVSWKRKEAQAQSLPARVFQGSAEFEESLYLKSTVYGTKDGSKGIKFEPKCFDLAVIALDVDELVLGKHRLDLSRLVPKISEEENDRSWTTRFKLAGKAKGGTLIVTFACQLLNKNSDSGSNLSSARFSDSPMVKPLRSYNSLPSSPEGTSRSGWPPANAANAFSPAMSEMPIDGEYMRMEHLSLNDEFSPAAADSVPVSSGKKKSSQKGQTRPVFSDSPQPVSLKELSYNQQAASSERQLMRKALSFDDDDGSEFTVVCQGHELSAIVDAGAPLPEYDDPKAEEDTVQGLPEGDTEADVHDDSLQDSVAPQAQAAVDAPEVVKFLSDDKFSRKEQAEELSNVTLQSRNSQVAESGSDDKFPQVGEAGLVSEHSPVDVAVVEVERKSEASLGEFSSGAIEKEEEEDIVDVQEDWSVSVVEDLDVLTKSWSVGMGERNNVVEKHEFYREEFLLDEKEDEDATMFVIVVDSKGDEKATNVGPGEENGKDDERATNVEENDEENQEEEKTTDVIVVKSNVSEEEEEEEESSDMGIQSMSTSPALQVKTKEEALEEDDYDRVCGEFMSLLRDSSPPCEHSESGEDSPRAQLLKQFEQEALIEGGLELNFHLPEYAKFRVEGAQENKNDVNTPRAGDQPDSPMVAGNVTDVIDNADWGNEDDVELAAIIEAAEAELEKATQILQSKARAKLLEDEETKALMQAWGLNDRAFEAAEPEPESAADMSMAIVPVAPAPPLGNGLGPVLRFHDGGSVRSMSPSHFQGAAAGGAGGRLLMQASNPVVVPAEMGATSMDILRRMAVAGMEGMAAQAMMAMPLEDLTGKALDQIPVEQRPTPAGFTQPLGSRRHGYPAIVHGENSNTTTLAIRENARTTTSSSLTVTSYSSRFSKWNGTNSSEEHMALEDLTPMAMLKIEALALEGLKVQVEMTDQDAPYAVEPLAEEANFTRRGVGGLRVAGMALLEGGNSRRSHAGQGDFISMDEWMRLDAGVDTTEDDADEQTVATTTTGQQQTSWKQKHSLVRKDGRRGFMDDTVTLAMLVHLRDPLRSNEPVGAPMMALVQAERVTKPGRRLSSATRSFSEQQEKSDDDSTQPAAAAQFKIVDITIAGLRTSTEFSDSTPKAEIWGTQKQLAAGSRWLAAHGMAKAASRSSSSFKGKPAATKSALWSMSERVYGSGARWRGGAPLHPHIRNPDVLFADTGIRSF